MKKIILTGGGTAGHIYPALSLVPLLEKEYEIFYIGGNGMEKEILKDFKNIKFYEIPVVKLERKLTLKNFLIPFKLIKSIKKSRQILKEIKPDIIFSKGGFVSVPTVIAGHNEKIPVISHESDLTMGLANKIILHYCNIMCTTFYETSKKNKKCIYTGQPIRDKIFKGNSKKIIDKFSNHNLPILLILGGSSGAKFINKIIYENIEILSEKFNIIHICGKKNYKEFEHKNYIQIPYADNIQDYYKACNYVISRAGSGVINELIILNKPTLLIPLSKKCSRGDQIENAKLFSNLNYSYTLFEEDYTPTRFLNSLDNLVKNKDFLIKNMKNFTKINANQEIFNLIKKNS